MSGTEVRNVHVTYDNAGKLEVTCGECLALYAMLPDLSRSHILAARCSEPVL